MSSVTTGPRAASSGPTRRRRRSRRSGGDRPRPVVTASSLRRVRLIAATCGDRRGVASDGGGCTPRGLCSCTGSRWVAIGYLHHCRVPARQPGNFLLLAQKKVTKEEGPNAKPLSSLGALRTPGPAGDLTTRGRSTQQPARTLRARFASPLAPEGCGVRMQTRYAALASSFSGSAVQRCSGLTAALWACGASKSSSQRALQPQRPSRRCGASRNVRASRWCDASRGVRSPAGPGVRSEKNELRGF
jgi:hypothetical protein